MTVYGIPLGQGAPLPQLTTIYMRATYDTLQRWLADLQYNAVRRIETPSLLTTFVRENDGRPLRGVLLAPNLVMTRQKSFYQLKDDGKAVVLADEQVVDQYDVRVLQFRYKELQDEWKASHQHSRT